ncbi:MAG: GH3 auxin-responsive promoter family protein [Rhodomicrobium sp.]
MLDATPLLRLYARYRLPRLAAQNPAAVQREQLLKLVAHARETRFGRDHAFAVIHSVADYQNAVPLRRYEDFWEAYWRDRFPQLTDVTWPGRIPYFAVTSGTATGVTKHIPVSREMVRANRRAVLDLLAHHIASRPRSRVLGGKSFMLGGSTDLVRCAPGVAEGDLSGIAVNEVPRWARSRYFPPRDLALISDWEEKIQRLASRSLEEDIRTIGGTPSWLLVLFERLQALRPGTGGRLAGYYPNLELLVHGGVSFAPYRERFETLLEGSHAELREVYPASEGFIALADRGPGEGLRLLLDNGLFFEFIPDEELGAPNPTRHWIGTAEAGLNYAIAVTSCAGLWSSIIGDTVRFISLDPPRISITGRTSYSLSAFGEHLIGEEIEGAVSMAAAAIGASVTDYSVSPIYPSRPGETGHHLYAVEFSALVSPGDCAKFARLLDERLCALNADYAAHRAGDFAMLAPTVEVLPHGTFARWMKSRGKLGGQNKVPRILLDTGLFESLLAASAGR